MKVTVVTGQLDCLLIFAALGIDPEQIKPVPPNTATTGMTGRDNLWTVIENVQGVYRIHVVEGTQSEAWAVFDSTFQGPKISPRIEHIGGHSKTVPVNN